MKSSIKSGMTGFYPAFIMIICFCLAEDISYAQKSFNWLKSASDVDSNYIGWLGDPDTLVVFVDSSYTQSEKDSIQKAMNRWNGVLTRPKLRMWKGVEPYAPIFFKTNPDLKSQGLCTSYFTKVDGKEKYKKATIQRDTNHAVSLTELATHELGHALGLNDTDGSANPGDVMRGDPQSNGTNGSLSAHDSAEIKMADATWIYNQRKKVQAPVTATVPGSSVTLTFLLDETYPPDIASQAQITIFPKFNPYLIIEDLPYIIGNHLFTKVTLDPMHWSGIYYLRVEADLPDPYQDFLFLGWHHAHIDPVPPTFFDIFFDIVPTDGDVTIGWGSNYPYPGQLRAKLIVDDTIKFYSKGGGPFVLDLAPGTHVFTLEVDDFKNNYAHHTQSIFVGQPEIAVPESVTIIAPNPFSEACKISCNVLSDVRIFDLQGKTIWAEKGESVLWDPSADIKPGLYLVTISSPGRHYVGKILYQPRHIY